jgi:hypothetical protein
LYLRAPSFPWIYLGGLGMVALFSLAGVALLMPRGVGRRRFDWHMFALGVAFSLLEVKSLTTFSLLFGATWLVNSMVFFAILLSVLLAIAVNSRFRLRRVSPFYVLLFAVLAVNLFLPPSSLLFAGPVVRYILASVMAFAPVFLANIVFSNAFRESTHPDVAFASNLLGIMAGGMLEYLGMLTGYRLLVLPIMAFYGLAWWLSRRRVAAPLAEAAG